MQYRRHIITDPTIYLTAQRDGFCIGTAEQAAEGGWLSWEQLRQELGSEDKLV
jgi:hypothetical protein